MREINIDLQNLKPQYECGNCGEANAATLKINVSSIKDDATHFFVVLKNAFSEVFCSEKIEMSALDNENINFQMWQALTKTEKEILVVEAYKVNEESNIEFLRKSPVVNLHFESSVSSDDALNFDKEYYGLLKELHNLEDNITRSINEAETAAQTAISTTNEIIELKNSGAFIGPQGPQGIQGEKGEKGEKGTTNYSDLVNRPSINNIMLDGEKTLGNLGIVDCRFLKSDEEFTEFMNDLMLDLAKLSPVMFVIAYGSSEASGFPAGTGYIVLDSGTGSLDDAILIPLTFSDVAFTSEYAYKITQAYNLASRTKFGLISTIGSGGTLTLSSLKLDVYSVYFKDTISGHLMFNVSVGGSNIPLLDEMSIRINSVGNDEELDICYDISTLNPRTEAVNGDIELYYIKNDVSTGAADVVNIFIKAKFYNSYGTLTYNYEKYQTKSNKLFNITFDSYRVHIKSAFGEV